MEDITTEKEALQAIAEGATLDSIPCALMTQAVCLAAVKDDGAALCLVPEELKTEAMCKMAVLAASPDIPDEMQNIYEAVPDCFRTAGLSFQAVVHDPLGSVMYMVPDEIKTPAFCASAVSVGLMAAAGGEEGGPLAGGAREWLSRTWEGIPEDVRGETAAYMLARDDLSEELKALVRGMAEEDGARPRP